MHTQRLQDRIIQHFFRQRCRGTFLTRAAVEQGDLGGHGMLYHWYELDPESAVAETDTSARDRPHRATLQYNATAAFHRACGGSVRFDLSGFELTAANDCQPDAHAARLRETGLGRVGHCEHASRSNIIRAVSQIGMRCWCVFREMSSTILSVLHFATQVRGRNDDSCSHTIVLNGADDPACVPDGARRQRFQSSVRHTAK